MLLRQQGFDLESGRHALGPLVDELVQRLVRIDVEDDDGAATELGVNVLGGPALDERVEPVPPLLLVVARSRRFFGSWRTDDEKMHAASGSVATSRAGVNAK